MLQTNNNKKLNKKSLLYLFGYIIVSICIITAFSFSLYATIKIKDGNNYGVLVWLLLLPFASTILFSPAVGVMYHYNKYEIEVVANENDVLINN